MNGGPRALARRYARALLDVAERRGPDAALALRDELRSFARAVSAHADLWRVLRHPGLSAERRLRVVLAVAQTAGVSALLSRLLEMLAARDRLALLPDLVEEYAEVANAARGVVTAEVAAATPLAEAQRRAIGAVLGDAVELRTRVDPALVGGLVVRVGEKTYDGSVRTRLATLRRRLAASG